VQVHCWQHTAPTSAGSSTGPWPTNIHRIEGCQQGKACYDMLTWVMAHNGWQCWVAKHKNLYWELSTIAHLCMRRSKGTTPTTMPTLPCRSGAQAGMTTVCGALPLPPVGPTPPPKHTHTHMRTLPTATHCSRGTRSAPPAAAAATCSLYWCCPRLGHPLCKIRQQAAARKLNTSR
jgi:hypothetical protein